MRTPESTLSRGASSKLTMRQRGSENYCARSARFFPRWFLTVSLPHCETYFCNPASSAHHLRAHQKLRLRIRTPQVSPAGVRSCAAKTGFRHRRRIDRRAPHRIPRSRRRRHAQSPAQEKRRRKPRGAVRRPKQHAHREEHSGPVSERQDTASAGTIRAVNRLVRERPTNCIEIATLLAAAAAGDYLPCGNFDAPRR